MATRLAFLRAINLGAKRVFPKADILRVVTSVGFEDVATHINTGNVRFDTRMRSRPRIEATLEQAFASDRGFDVPTVTFSATEFADLAAEAQQINADHPGLARHYVYLLKEPLAVEQCAAVEATRTEHGRMLVRDRAAHALLTPGYQNGTVDPLGAARLLGVATNRNLNVIQTLAAKWC
ncbi:DUF1697 domain-containing protein [Microbacterium invictum]|uniref:Uncharacterized protein (DUF1697 family) n=1 Tax=Microbacterium invictum TaxID=515415 RepID=A0AA40SQH4_9MICO|nr:MULTISPECIES: DUF1697 domain-containing protein [Microbacterium]MBB4140385.1 uncharacterized protein (DUF1697 family) [Microbacterium invictum]